MTTAVNLAAFHEMTGGDPALEQKLFKDFLKSATQCFSAMQKSWAKGKETVWRYQAHAFKGICLNLGAVRLGQLCKEAQDNSNSEPEEKLILLKVIECELESVKRFLDEV